MVYIKNLCCPTKEVDHSDVGALGCVNTGKVNCTDQDNTGTVTRYQPCPLLDRLKECSVQDQEERWRMEAVCQPQSSRNQTTLADWYMGSCSRRGKFSGPSIKRSESLVTSKQPSLVEWTHMDLKSRRRKRNGGCIWNDSATTTVHEGNESESSMRSRRISHTPCDKHTLTRHRTCRKLWRLRCVE